MGCASIKGVLIARSPRPSQSSNPAVMNQSRRNWLSGAAARKQVPGREQALIGYNIAHISKQRSIQYLLGNSLTLPIYPPYSEFQHIVLSRYSSIILLWTLTFNLPVTFEVLLPVVVHCFAVSCSSKTPVHELLPILDLELFSLF